MPIGHQETHELLSIPGGGLMPVGRTAQMVEFLPLSGNIPNWLSVLGYAKLIDPRNGPPECRLNNNGDSGTQRAEVRTFSFDPAHFRSIKVHVRGLRSHWNGEKSNVPRRYFGFFVDGNSNQHLGYKHKVYPVKGEFEDALGVVTPDNSTYYDSIYAASGGSENFLMEKTIRDEGSLDFTMTWLPPGDVFSIGPTADAVADGIHDTTLSDFKGHDMHFRLGADLDVDSAGDTNPCLTFSRLAIELRYY